MSSQQTDDSIPLDELCADAALETIPEDQLVALSETLRSVVPAHLEDAFLSSDWKNVCSMLDLQRKACEGHWFFSRLLRGGAFVLHVLNSTFRLPPPLRLSLSIVSQPTPCDLLTWPFSKFAFWHTLTRRRARATRAFAHSFAPALLPIHSLWKTRRRHCPLSASAKHCGHTSSMTLCDCWTISMRCTSTLPRRRPANLPS